MTVNGDIFYSNNGEDYNFTDFEEAVQERLELMEHGDTAIIFKASAVLRKGSEFFPDDTFERLEENAYNEVEDFMSDWLDKVNDEHEQDLKKILGEALDKFLADNNLSPNFFTVKDVKKIKIECLDYLDLDKSYIVVEDNCRTTAFRGKTEF